MESLHAQLKSQTADLHSSIERNSLMSRVMEPDFSEQEYIRLLQKQLSFYLKVEASLHKIPRLMELLPDSKNRIKSHSLRQDLAAMNSPVLEEEVHLPINNLAQALGVLYVLEGSSLGGQVIARKLKDHGFINDQNLNFFNHYGSETGVFWRRFLAFLEEQSQRDDVPHKEVVTSARKTFQSLMQHLKSN